MTASIVRTADMPDAFLRGWVAACRARGWNPRHGFSVMHSESTLRPGAVNRASGIATGLIQWDPPENSGHDQASLRALGFMGQLPLVVAWWDAAERRNGAPLARAGDFYRAVFLPGTMGQPEPIAGAHGPHADAYAANRLLDPNRTGFITRATLEERLALAERTQDPARWSEALARLRAFAPEIDRGPWIAVAAVGVGVAVSAFAGWWLARS